LDAEIRVDPHAPPVVDRQTELGEYGVGADACRPDERARGDHLVGVRELGPVRAERVERRPDADVDAALRQLLGGVFAEPGRDLGEDLRRCVDEDPALRLALQLRVVAQRVSDEIV
jgi:hypothetical protein